MIPALYHLILLHCVGICYSSLGPFCESNITELRGGSPGPNIFPLDTPSSILKLWPWDAVHNIEKGTVEVTVIQRRACRFNQTKWHLLVDKFPQFSKLLAHGKEENILADSNETNLAKLEVVICRFYVNGTSTPVAQTKAEPVLGKYHFLRGGTTQIICPIPQMNYDTMRLVRLGRIEDGVESEYSSLTSNHEKVKVASDAFPVCRPASLRKGLTEIEFEERKKGRLSVCTATGRSDRAHLIEWIEYHRLIGVDHFYIYDTSKQQNGRGILTLLSDYVSEGVVTIVPWAYDNCVRGMASGRFLTWNDPESGFNIFHPPKAIAQSAALASCYSRYRSHTEYMMHIDDDEFIAMGPSVMVEGFGHNRSHLTNNGQIYRPLAEFVDKVLTSRPDAPALAFPPLRKHECPTLDGGISKARVSSGLPRIGEWVYGRKRKPIEVKLVMRTSAVINFYVHYISQYEKAFLGTDVLLLSPTDVAVLHYKEPEEMAGDLFGVTKLNEFELGATNHFCKEMQRFGGLREDIEGGYFPAVGKAATPFLHNLNYTNIIQSISPAIQSMLLQNFQERMRL